MTTDDLNKPLGQGRPRRIQPDITGYLKPAVAAVLAAMLLLFAGWSLFVENPLGGEPMATAAADVRTDVAANGTPVVIAAPAVAETAAAPPASTPAGTKTITIIDGTSGERRDIAVPGSPAAAAPAGDAAEARYSEPSRHGPLPRIAQDGTRPSEAFARPVKAIPGNPQAPRIAIIIAGLGIGASGTADAIRKLPGSVTFAFAPYGNNLDAQIARARETGHELLLQVPMEPFDYPDNDPGPQTLLTSLDSGQNTDRLHWLMSRFQGYVGIANYMGGRFTASEQAMAPVLRETAKRGLLYMDDASSPRSLASQIAGANNLPFAKADVILDQVPNAGDVDKALARLEAVARAKGSAVGVASALPAAIDRIARWSKAAESRGILLVPISAVASKPRSS